MEKLTWAPSTSRPSASRTVTRALMLQWQGLPAQRPVRQAQLHGRVPIATDDHHRGGAQVARGIPRRTVMELRPGASASSSPNTPDGPAVIVAVDPEVTSLAVTVRPASVLTRDGDPLLVDGRARLGRLDRRPWVPGRRR